MRRSNRLLLEPYQILESGGFLDKRGISKSFNKLSNDDIKKTLGMYRDFYIKNESALFNLAKAKSSEVSIMPECVSQRVSLSLLIQLGLYVHRVVVSDPLLGKTIPDRFKYMPLVRKNEIPEYQRKDVRRALEQLAAIRPMVEAGYVRLLPLEFLQEPPYPIPVTYSKDAWAHSLPPSTMKFCRDNAAVDGGQLTSKGQLIITGPLESPCRVIRIRFKDDPSLGYIYNLFHIKGVDEKSHTVFSVLSPDSPSPDGRLFAQWLFQSIDRAGLTRVSEIERDLYVAAVTNSSLLTQSRFVDRLLTQDIGKDVKAGKKNQVVTGLLEMNLPVFSDISPAELMKVRREEGEAFEAFRMALDAGIRKIGATPGTKEFQKELEEVQRDLLHDKVYQVEQKVKQLRSTALRKTTVASAWLAATVISKGITVVPFIAALGQAWDAYRDYYGGIRQSPAFFFWRLSKEGK
jgi:hypothetical protein